jgi:hypothetical protein
MSASKSFSLDLNRSGDTSDLVPPLRVAYMNSGGLRS